MKLLFAPQYLEKAQKRFMAFVKVLPNGCWEWQGSFDGEGRYPLFWLRPRLQVATRAALQLFKNTDPGKLQACHHCDNTSCVNPDHLFVGTQLENEADKVAKGRSERGSGRYNAKLTEADVIAIRASTATNREISEQYGIAAPNVSSIRLKKIWKHVP